MTDRKSRSSLSSLLFAAILVSPSFAPAAESYSPNAGQSYPLNVYWGDTHLHSKISLDAAAHGNERLGPQEAYRFARGETVTAHNGMKARLRRPLDFLVIADHDFNLGLFEGLRTSDPRLLNTRMGTILHGQYRTIQAMTDTAARAAAMEKFQLDFWNTAKEEAVKDEAYRRSIWQEVVANADKFNDPETFTAFVGYEWTSTGVEVTGNLHRVVIFADGAGKADQILPFSTFDSRNPQALWDFFSGYERKTGGKVLAIPHNGNLSNGEMFAPVDFDGQPLGRSYAEARSRWEPLYEVTQIKGNGEAHPRLSTTDEFADYEIWNSWLGRDLEREWKFSGKDFRRKWNETELTKKQYEYARSALKAGLQFQARLGANPFKFGMAGGTDAHTSLATADDDNFWGKLSRNEPQPQRMTASPWGSPIPGWELSAAGYTAVWAPQNTREALFAAMKRKETYASTGPRMTVRFFGGWDYAPEDAFKPDLALIGYRKGVPMGGDLTNAPAGKAPRFLIRAAKDPDGANLDRVQIIKGWRDKSGQTHEKIYDVALADGRKAATSGEVPPVGSTVDVARASFTNAIGDSELAVMWTDPDFDKDAFAFYYVRVIEIPTPRWTAYDAKFFRIKDIPAQAQMITQERAYTSPIWYAP